MNELNDFERELRKLVDAGLEPGNVTFAGRACYVDLGGQNRAKIQFTTVGYADRYQALSVDILNRVDGKVDSLLFRFADVWGNKLTNNSNFDGGVVPHIWLNKGRYEWVVYKPTLSDFEILAESVSKYLSVFAERDEERGVDREQDKSAFNEALKRGKTKSEESKAKTAEKPPKSSSQKKEAK